MEDCEGVGGGELGRGLGAAPFWEFGSLLLIGQRPMTLGRSLETTPNGGTMPDGGTMPNCGLRPTVAQTETMSNVSSCFQPD